MVQHLLSSAYATPRRGGGLPAALGWWRRGPAQTVLTPVNQSVILPNRACHLFRNSIGNVLQTEMIYSTNGLRRAEGAGDAGPLACGSR